MALNSRQVEQIHQMLGDGKLPCSDCLHNEGGVTTFIDGEHPTVECAVADVLQALHGCPDHLRKEPWFQTTWQSALQLIQKKHA